MLATIETFICRIKEDTYKFLADLSSVGIAAFFMHTEHWLLVHGAALLIFGRLLLLGLDCYKRFRDVNKPEWKNIVSPVLKKEAVRGRRKSGWQKFKDNFLKPLIKW